MIEDTLFYKMTAGGNDFILIPDFERRIEENLVSHLSKKLCHRQLSVGADGLIVLKPSQRAHFRWLFFNADGSEAEMCGNGGRCAAFLAHMLKKAPSELIFETKVGLIKGWIRGKTVKITLPPPCDLKLGLEIEVEGKRLQADFINTGVPHLVVFVEDLERVDVKNLGRTLRFHPYFSPTGTNVNFVKWDGEALRIRTYERGVEDETFSCGTGATASALIAHLRGFAFSPTKVIPSGGEPLWIYYESEGSSIKEVALEGLVRLVYEGRLKEAIW
jgi:diaminopimelate epimerase